MEDKQSEILAHIYSVMDLHNAVDSYGTIILKNGLVVNFLSNFELVERTWKVYLKLKNAKRWQELQEFLDQFDGGIVTDGGNSVNLADIVGTCAVHRFDSLNLETKEFLENRADKILDYMTLISGVVDLTELNDEEDESEEN